MLTVGTKAPEFSLPDQNGTIHTLSEYAGKTVVLYFYSRDNTGGCTSQAVGFAQLADEFAKLNAVIIGISKDSVASHERFAQKYNLPFTLLSDPELTAIQAYDVWHEKKLYGKVSMGTVRTTYIIDNAGTIVDAKTKVKAAENPRQTLDTLLVL
ncbi:MAG: peroxiredoxin [Coriobacteriales bacterium]|nr:peroxiredoxin [Coriobacteriales bacterium]